MPSPKLFVPKWSLSVTHNLIVHRGSLSLGVTLTSADGEEWAVLAIETPSEPIRNARGTNAKMEQVLAKHSHKLLGTHGLTDAIQVATDYARKWLASTAVDETCGCQDIPDPVDDLDFDGIAHAVLGKMTPEERSAFARGELPKTPKKPRGRVGSALKGARNRDVRQSKAASHP